MSNCLSSGVTEMNMKRNPGGPDHSKTTPGWHNLQDCATCLKIFLPGVYERESRKRREEAIGERRMPIDSVKKRGRGMPFVRTKSQTPKDAFAVGAI
jgi:hypothetical protein